MTLRQDKETSVVCFGVLFLLCLDGSVAGEGEGVDEQQMAGFRGGNVASVGGGYRVLVREHVSGD